MKLPMSRIRKIAGIVSTLIAMTSSAPAVAGEPLIEGDTVTVSDSGYWQVEIVVAERTAGTDPVICQGFTICRNIPAGHYNVINLTTGERYENIQISPSTRNATTGSNTASTTGIPTVSSYTFTFPNESDWFSVQDSDNFKTYCQGRGSCTVIDENGKPRSGTYTVINHDADPAQRWPGYIVSSSTFTASPDARLYSGSFGNGTFVARDEQGHLRPVCPSTNAGQSCITLQPGVTDTLFEVGDFYWDLRKISELNIRSLTSSDTYMGNSQENGVTLRQHACTATGTVSLSQGILDSRVDTTRTLYRFNGCRFRETDASAGDFVVSGYSETTTNAQQTLFHTLWTDTTVKYADGSQIHIPFMVDSRFGSDQQQSAYGWASDVTRSGSARSFSAAGVEVESTLGGSKATAHFSDVQLGQFQ